MDVVITTAGTILREHLLSATISLPLVAALLLALIPARFANAIRAIAMLAGLGTLGLAALIAVRTTGAAELQLQESVPWIPALGIAYRVGVDGVSMALIGLTALLTVAGLFISWNEIGRQVKAFHLLLLVTEAALIGVFSAVDMFLFYVFWDAALVPMCLIIAMWGSGGRVRAAVKFILFTMAGGLCMLGAILYAGWTTGSFDLIQWYAHRFTIVQQFWLFAAFFLAFGVKVPLLGLHTWLPDAHAEAPTAGSVLLAGVFLKMGVYGFYRVAMPLFPAALAQSQELILVLAVAGVIGGALLAMVQEDLKRLIAYTSISHLGLAMLGLAAREPHAAAGAVLQMVAHGLIAAALFIAASLLFHRRGTRRIAEYGGSARALPLIGASFIFVSLAAAGTPGLAGFSAEFPILLGAFQSVTPYAAAAVAGVVLMFACLFWAVQRVFFGPLRHEEERKFADLRMDEAGALVPLMALIVLLGLWPQGLLERVWKPANAFVQLSRRVEMVIPAFPQPPRQPAVERSEGIVPVMQPRAPDEAEVKP